jgi:hypothetical protein
MVHGAYVGNGKGNHLKNQFALPVLCCLNKNGQR